MPEGSQECKKGDLISVTRMRYSASHCQTRTEISLLGRRILYTLIWFLSIHLEHPHPPCIGMSTPHYHFHTVYSMADSLTPPSQMDPPSLTFVCRQVLSVQLWITCSHIYIGRCGVLCDFTRCVRLDRGKWLHWHKQVLHAHCTFLKMKERHLLQQVREHSSDSGDTIPSGQCGWKAHYKESYNYMKPIHVVATEDFSVM